MQPTSISKQRGPSVSVGHAYEPAAVCLNQSRCGLGSNSCGHNEPFITLLHGIEIPMGRGNFGGCLAH